MSIDPLAAGVADLAALVDAELNALAADAAALRNLLVEGSVVTARVLPSNGLTDLIEIAGLRVAASLPPTVRPGDVLTVQVKGFDGDRVLVQIVDTPPEQSPPPPLPLSPSQAYLAAAIQPASPQPFDVAPAQPYDAPIPPPVGPPPITAQTVAPQTVAPQTAGTQPTPVPPVAPRVVVTAAPQPSSAAQIGSVTVPPIVARPSLGAAYGATPARAETPQPGAAGATPPPSQTQPTSLEARLAAARTAVANAAARIAGKTPEPPSLGTTPKPATLPQPQAAPGPSRFVPPPSVAAKAPAPVAQPRAQVVAPPPAQPPPRTTGLSAYTQPVALLRALRLPVTPTNVASATMALERPERLPAALETLERALPQVSDEPAVATLRTLLSFVGRIDPKSPVLAAQIAAYVDQVIDGAEPKIATFLAAAQATDLMPPPIPAPAPQPVVLATAGAPASTAPNAPAAAPGEPPPAASTPSPPPPVIPHAPPPVAAALAVERGAAMSVDLKQTILALAASPQTAPSLAPALSGALSAITAVQVGAAQMLATQPSGIAFSIPLATEFGQRNAHISVQRDAPESRGAALDTNNFRIAFILETAHYGTVAIDLVTVGREVTIDLRAETGTAMRAFRDALSGLTARLESLNYKVASAGASLGTTTTIAVEAPPSSPPAPDATVDRQA